jgi:hypothetical protein
VDLSLHTPERKLFCGWWSYSCTLQGGGYICRWWSCYCILQGGNYAVVGGAVPLHSREEAISVAGGVAPVNSRGEAIYVAGGAVPVYSREELFLWLGELVIYVLDSFSVARRNNSLLVELFLYTIGSCFFS